MVVSVPVADDVTIANFDCIVQCVPPLCQRLVRFFEDDAIRSKLFPNGGCKEMFQLSIDFPPGQGPRDELLCMKHLTISPLELKTFIDTSYIRHSITRLYFIPSSSSANWCSSPEELIHRCSTSSFPPPIGPVRIMAFPKGSLETYLGDHLPASWDLHPVKYEHTFFAVATSPTDIRYSLRYVFFIMFVYVCVYS